MRAGLSFGIGLTALTLATGAASAQTRGGAAGNGGSINCVGCIVYGDMIAGSGGAGGNAYDNRGGRRTRGSADRQTDVGPGSKCISYNGRSYCD